MSVLYLNSIWSERKKVNSLKETSYVFVRLLIRCPRSVYLSFCFSSFLFACRCMLARAKGVGTPQALDEMRGVTSFGDLTSCVASTTSHAMDEMEYRLPVHLPHLAAPSVLNNALLRCLALHHHAARGTLGKAKWSCSLLNALAYCLFLCVA